MKKWHIKYKEHDIEIQNSWFKGEALLVDGTLQDQRIGFAVRSQLYGKIENGQGEGETIKVSLGGWFCCNCIVFINNKEVFRS